LKYIPWIHLIMKLNFKSVIRSILHTFINRVFTFMNFNFLYNSSIELNFLIFIFLTIFLFFFTSLTNARLLLNSELFWIILYVLAIIMSFFSDDIYLLALSLFFLMLSASEISIGLIFLSNQTRIGVNLETKFDN
jgi:hypothetical protein